MQLIEHHTFNTDKIQKKTLQTMRSKYRINVSEFIRAAIKEKLERDKETIFKNYNEIQSYLNKYNDCPF